MIAYVVRRFVYAIVVLLTVITVVFLLARLSGNPAQLMAPPNATQSDIETISQNLGLSDPIYVQYERYLLELTHADFGQSFSFRQPVRDLIINAAPYTATLAIAAFFLASTAGIILGTLSALHSGTWLDSGAQVVALLGQSVPSFWLGMVLVLVFAVQLKILPAFAPGGPDHIVLPAIALSVLPLAAITRLTRSATLEILRADFILFERSKGVTPRVFLAHLLRNASIPVVTVLGIQLGTLLSGTVIIETLFAWPGLGQLAIQAIQSRDYNVIQAVVLVDTAVFVLLNLLVDISYGWLDPRVRL